MFAHTIAHANHLSVDFGKCIDRRNSSIGAASFLPALPSRLAFYPKSVLFFIFA
jgi:hypothetical protein